MKVKRVATLEYMQKMRTEGNGLKIPIKKLIISVTEVIVIETAASLNIFAILSGTVSLIDVLLQAANITKVSSIPIPIIRNGAARLMPIKSMSRYIHVPNAATVAIHALTFPKSPSHGLDLTQSAIMHVTIENNAIITNVDVKYGMTVLVFFSNS
uniref:Uncharacterized protein n=1 Tax=Photinus pyralis TaxID=7054 RepID=A0A1Y1NIC6_PHOPY